MFFIFEVDPILLSQKVLEAPCVDLPKFYIYLKHFEPKMICFFPGGGSVDIGSVYANNLGNIFKVYLSS